MDDSLEMQGSVDFLITECSAKSLLASTIDFGNYFQHSLIHLPIFIQVQCNRQNLIFL